MNDLATQATLVVAALDLKLVQLLRGAMRAADLGAAASKGVDRITPAAVYEPARHVHLTPVIEPREHIRAAPCREPAKVVVTRSEQPRLALAISECRSGCEAAAPPAKSPVEPPWKVLPWRQPPKMVVNVKWVKVQPDIINKGSLIDCFI